MAHTARSAHAVNPSMSRSEAQAVTDASCSSHSTTVATSQITPALPMNAAVLAMCGLRILRMRRCLGGAVRVTHQSAKIQTVIVRNFSPALPRLVNCDDAVEALPGSVR